MKPNLGHLQKIPTLEYRIVVGLRLFINQNFFENVDEKKNQKLSQCLDWCKNVLKSWCEIKAKYSYSIAYAYLIF